MADKYETVVFAHGSVAMEKYIRVVPLKYSGEKKKTLSVPLDNQNEIIDLNVASTWEFCAPGKKLCDEIFVIRLVKMWAYSSGAQTINVTSLISLKPGMRWLSSKPSH